MLKKLSLHLMLLYLPSPPFLEMLHARSAIMTTAAAFCKNSSFAECILWEISSACVDTKLRGIGGTYIVSGGRDNHKPILKVIGTVERKGLACETRVNVLANTLNDRTRSKAH